LLHLDSDNLVMDLFGLTEAENKSLEFKV